MYFILLFMCLSQHLQKSHANILLTANIDEFRNMAKKVIPNELADQLVQMAGAYGVPKAHNARETIDDTPEESATDNVEYYDDAAKNENSNVKQKKSMAVLVEKIKQKIERDIEEKGHKKKSTATLDNDYSKENKSPSVENERELNREIYTEIKQFSHDQKDDQENINTAAVTERKTTKNIQESVINNPTERKDNSDYSEEVKDKKPIGYNNHGANDYNNRNTKDFDHGEHIINPTEIVDVALSNEDDKYVEKKDYEYKNEQETFKKPKINKNKFDNIKMDSAEKYTTADIDETKPTKDLIDNQNQNEENPNFNFEETHLNTGDSYENYNIPKKDSNRYEKKIHFEKTKESKENTYYKPIEPSKVTNHQNPVKIRKPDHKDRLSTRKDYEDQYEEKPDNFRNPEVYKKSDVKKNLKEESYESNNKQQHPGSNRYPNKNNNYPKNNDFPKNNDDPKNNYYPKNNDYPNKDNDYPNKDNDYPNKDNDYPNNNNDYSETKNNSRNKNHNFPNKNKNHPENYNSEEFSKKYESGENYYTTEEHKRFSVKNRIKPKQKVPINKGIDKNRDDKQPNNDENKRPAIFESVKAKTESLLFDEEAMATDKVNLNNKKTMIPTKRYYTLSTPNYYASQPTVVDKYDFNEPIPEKDRKREYISYIKDPKAIINNKYRITD